MSDTTPQPDSSTSPLSPPPVSAQPHAQPPEGETSGLAIASLVCGILGWVTCVTAIPAVILGHIAKSNLKRSQGQQKGKGLATAGLVLGYSACVFFFIAVLAALVTPVILTTLKKAELTKETSEIKMISVNLLEYKQANGFFPKQFSDLESSGQPLRIELDELLKIKADSGASLEWSYFPEANLTGSGAECLLVSPTIEGKSAVLFTDGSVRHKHGSTLKALISSQGGQVERIQGTRP